MSELDSLELSEPEKAQLIRFVVSGQGKLLRKVAAESQLSVARRVNSSTSRVSLLENGGNGWNRVDPKVIVAWFRLVVEWRNRYGDVVIAKSTGLPKWRL